jgi:Arc/MetJ-type ribon-helix-helix transcriptional regulator
MGSKTTLVIKDEIIMQVKEAVKYGYYKSLTSFVENALNNELKALKKAEIRKEIIAASKDPLFLADIAEIEEDFKYSDFE